MGYLKNLGLIDYYKLMVEIINDGGLLVSLIVFEMLKSILFVK